MRDLIISKFSSMYHYVHTLFMTFAARKAQLPHMNGDRLIIFKDHDVKGRSVLFDSSLPVDDSQQKEPSVVSAEKFTVYLALHMLTCYLMIGSVLVLSTLKIRFVFSSSSVNIGFGFGLVRVVH